MTEKPTPQSSPTATAMSPALVALNAASRIMLLLVEKRIITNEEAAQALTDIATTPDRSAV
ncbi:hypothetical protein HJA89_10180 [Rhizobium bangladeshense]|uniref:hypothetical protein n=1 Tax=Rhizobium TaxID=379 RepID=UPI001C82B891|nr:MULTISPECIES: hypothetical protein [Rhizobium]MBX4873268.1 hypothetical protein [Rhizobium bangladeshense]MBX4884645.1 hypothetical protein [Rhizobium bangladeshense]MBX5146358.1 hypothetical protein [Rhizobium lentis]